MNKSARDNRANQLNPNNKAYWSSRLGSQSGSSSGGRGVFDYEIREYRPNFVVDPPKRRSKDGATYAWVVCDHIDRFLREDAYGAEFVENFKYAAVYKSKKEAEADVILRMGRNGSVTFFRIRCIKFD